MKKLIAIIAALTLLLTVTACGRSEPPNETTAPSTDHSTQTAESPTANLSTEATTATTSPTTQEAETAETTRSDDPSKWSKEEIVDFYKNAAINSKSVKSKQTMTMSSLVVNEGKGFIGGFIEMVTPIFKSVLEDNSTEFDGITGGYEKIVPSDIKTAKAYKSGKYTVVEMTMVEQVDGAHGSQFEGTVGHAISVVGDLAIVQENLPMFYIDFDNADITIRYAKPTLKVKINDKGVIEKGTWTYEVQVNVKNLYIKNLRLPIELTIESGRGSVDYIITTGGGF